ncbi:MAG: hypothetical protein AB7U79_05835 [Candidatus Izemoplasmatales bacterium]
MTKKLLLIVVVVMSLLSVILIAVWGTLPESQNLPRASYISLQNYEFNEDNEKIINVYGVVTNESPYYTLTYVFSPDNALVDFNVTSSSDDVTVLLDVINHEILVNFSTSSSIGKSVTIRLLDRLTNQYDEVTLIFKLPIIITE